jgi:hypothetical protein
MKPISTLLAVAPMVLGSLLGCDPCKETVVEQVSSTEYLATISKRDCGAMGRGSTLVSIRLNGVPDNDTHGGIVLGLYGNKDVHVSWRDSRELTIDCPSCRSSDVDSQTVKSAGVTIHYGSELTPPK